ncbi:MAG: nitroreductase family deazaflavin-dependent oxidoreductase [Anaerolineales bacterium]
MSAFDKRPNRLLKFFFKVPVWFHNMGFGGWERLIGAQWMLIATAGRKTGKRREVMVDVMDYNKAADTYYIEAAYGAHADWFRNLQSNPIFEAQVGRRKFKARAGALSNEGAGEMLVQFYRRKPAYTRSVMAMAGMKFKNEDDLRAIAKNITLLAVKPEKE